MIGFSSIPILCFSSPRCVVPLVPRISSRWGRSMGILKVLIFLGGVYVAPMRGPWDIPTFTSIVVIEVMKSVIFWPSNAGWFLVLLCRPLDEMCCGSSPYLSLKRWESLRGIILMVNHLLIYDLYPHHLRQLVTNGWVLALHVSRE